MRETVKAASRRRDVIIDAAFLFLKVLSAKREHQFVVATGSTIDEKARKLKPGTLGEYDIQ